MVFRGWIFLGAFMFILIVSCTPPGDGEITSPIHEPNDLDRVLGNKSCSFRNTNLNESFYRGQLIDTHIHIPAIPDDPMGFGSEADGRPSLGNNVYISDYVCMMDTEGTTKVFAFFPVYDPIIDPSIEVVVETMNRYPNRFVPFIMPPDHDDREDGFPTVDARELEERLEGNPTLFKGYGEIGLYARGDHGGPKGAPSLLPDSPRMMEIYPVVRERGLLVYVHLGEGQQESFEQVLRANPDINFIWHGDQLITYDQDGSQNLKKLDEILDRNPNAYYGVDELYGDVWLLRPEGTKEDFLDHFQNYEPLLAKDVAVWKAFIERHPEQVLWGTDRGWSAPWSLDLDVGLTLTRYSRAFIGRLDPTVQENFAYRNAERLINSTERR